MQKKNNKCNKKLLTKFINLIWPYENKKNRKIKHQGHRLRIILLQECVDWRLFVAARPLYLLQPNRALDRNRIYIVQIYKYVVVAVAGSVFLTATVNPKIKLLNYTKRKCAILFFVVHSFGWYRQKKKCKVNSNIYGTISLHSIHYQIECNKSILKIKIQFFTLLRK